ncbi:ADP-ribosylglycohydrolase family protein [bacterium]|nr:ADP-ribosylglycohydrolase family protein [bacterium]
MAAIVLNRKEYLDKVYACWLGKNIGGTLGAPYECKKYTHDLTYYDPVPDKSAPNDDLDLQLVWLVMLENEGLPPRLATFGRYWKTFLHKYPWNEYGFCNRNLARGLTPPVSGWFENCFVDEMGSPIRSELWACIAPADPQTAASLAWMDSAMDHAGGEGTHGEMFWAAVESAAFVIDDPVELIRIGLAMIPPACNISRVIREALWCWRHGVRYDDARERITSIYATEQPCHAAANHGFTVLGLLYGASFGDKLCKTVNCGYDTDCTGATLGALLGIMGGTACIPAAWSRPVGTRIVLHPFTIDCGVPKTLKELTARTGRLAGQLAAETGSVVSFGATQRVPAGVLSLLHRNEKAFAALRQDVRCGSAAEGLVEVFLHYNGDPVLQPGVARRMAVTARTRGREVPGTARVRVPRGWHAEPARGAVPFSFDLVAPAYTAPAKIVVDFNASGVACRAAFTVLSPNDAQGYPNIVRSSDWKPGMKINTWSSRKPSISFSK